MADLFFSLLIFYHLAIYRHCRKYFRLWQRMVQSLCDLCFFPLLENLREILYKLLLSHLLGRLITILGRKKPRVFRGGLMDLLLGDLFGLRPLPLLPGRMRKSDRACLFVRARARKFPKNWRGGYRKPRRPVSGARNRARLATNRNFLEPGPRRLKSPSERPALGRKLPNFAEIPEIWRNAQSAGIPGIPRKAKGGR